jgi:predicted TIM-barrel fold metal-dependent hydrolase
MRVIDAHLHCTGRETTDDVLRTLDEAQVDVGVLLAPFLSEGYSLDEPASLCRANDHLAALVRGHGDRLVGFAVVNPGRPGADAELERAVDAGLRGVKMVPSGWFPHDAAVQSTFAVAARRALPMLFHSGIFIDGRSGRWCRPVEFEVLRDHPGVRVALAHLGWPWTDEAIAVGLIDRIHGVPEAQAVFRFDLSFGPPPPYRLEVLRRALEVLGPGLLQFGSDCFLPCPGAQLAERRRWLAELLDELALDAASQARIWSGTAAAWLGLADDDAEPRGAGLAGAEASPRAADPGALDAPPAGAPRHPIEPGHTGTDATTPPRRRLPGASPVGPWRPGAGASGHAARWLGGRRIGPLCC